MKAIMNNINVNELVGKAFEELSIETMEELQGSGDVNPRTTPATGTILVTIETGVISYTAVTAVFCRP
ncbi:lichenicidin A2 family type 2 lantibiotic [Bacillus cereus]